jgi:hypothetical protein
VTPSLAGISPTGQTNSPQARNRRFQFHKRRQLLIRVHNETLSVAANNNNKGNWHESGWMDTR